MSKQETPEEVIARLTKENEDLSKDNTKLSNANEAAKTKLEALNAQVKKLTEANDDLSAQLTAATTNVTVLTSKLENLQQSFDQLTEESTVEIEKLSGELAKAKAIADVAEPSFNLDGTDHLVTGKRFTWKGKEYTTEQLLKNETLQRQLIAAKVGFITKK